jgi:hypothetical protein
VFVSALSDPPPQAAMPTHISAVMINATTTRNGLLAGASGL